MSKCSNKLSYPELKSVCLVCCRNRVDSYTRNLGSWMLPRNSSRPITDDRIFHRVLAGTRIVSKFTSFLDLVSTTANHSRRKFQYELCI